MVKFKWCEILVTLCLLCMLSACNGKSNKSAYPYSIHVFHSEDNQLTGRLYLPDGHTDSDPIVILVHGDGAMDSTANGFYLPIIQSLLSENIAAFSWDKPGVGQSQGHWLTQSMMQRAAEVKDVISYLKRNGYQHNPIHLLGFSQASWVFAHLHDEPNIDSMILVGGAANWLAQSQYSMWIRLLEEEKIDANDMQAIAKIKELSQQEYHLIKTGYDHYLSSPLHQHPFMSDPIADEARFNFIRNNIDADVHEGFSQLTVPMLAIFGDSDTHVDIEHSQLAFATAYASSISSKASLVQVTIPNASHSLLKPELPFDALFSIEKQHFAPDAIETIVNWLTRQHPGDAQ